MQNMADDAAMVRQEPKLRRSRRLEPGPVKRSSRQSSPSLSFGPCRMSYVKES